jgi:Tol biopolymer transport system component
MYHEDQWKVNGGKLKRVLESIVVQNVHTGVRRVYKFPLADWVYSGCWMGDDQTLLLVIKRDVKAPGANFEIYRYDLVSRRLTNLTNHPGVDHGPHWISGPLAVFPAGKLTTLWGQLKQTD